MSKIDVSRYVQEMEQALHSRQDPVQCENALAILRRWQVDEMLDDPSRAKAKMLVREFESLCAQTRPAQAQPSTMTYGSARSQGPR